jgi:hypothetical protein
MIINVESLRILKEVVIFYFKYYSSILPEQNEENKGGGENIVIWPKFSK